VAGGVGKGRRCGAPDPKRLGAIAATSARAEHQRQQSCESCPRGDRRGLSWGGTSATAAFERAWFCGVDPCIASGRASFATGSAIAHAAVLASYASVAASFAART
jgi:hypothetical protein